MQQRTFGWIQNPANIDNLKNTVGIFVQGSAIHDSFLKDKIPFLLDYDLIADPAAFGLSTERLREENIKVPYDELKGKGAGSAGRRNAKCSGLVQAVVVAQKNITVTSRTGATMIIKKPYTDDWTADGFLRWAISIGLLHYDKEKDECCVTELGEHFVKARFLHNSKPQ